MSTKKAMVLGMLIGDGWISKNKKIIKDSYQIGFSGDEESMYILKEDLIEIYGDIGKAKITTKKTENKNLGIVGYSTSFCANQKVAEDMISLGCPYGRLVEKEWRIPEWIINGEEDVKWSFLSGFYAAEGYTPAMQKNDITPKVLGFNFRTRLYIDESGVISDFEKILNDLDIKYSLFQIVLEDVSSQKIEFIISNESSNYIHFLENIDLRYAVEKKEISESILEYIEYKNRVLENLSQALEMSRDLSISATTISDMFGVKKRVIYSWRQRNTTKPKYPPSEKTYNDFFTCPS